MLPNNIYQKIICTRCILLSLLLAFSFLIRAQSPGDSVVLKNMIDEIFQQINKNPSAALNTAKTAEKMLDAKYSKRLLTLSHRALGESYSATGDSKNALEHLNKSLSLIDSGDHKSLGEIYTAFGNMYGNIGNLKMSIENQLRSLKEYEKAKIDKEMWSLKQNLAISFAQSGKPDKALEYFKDVLKQLISIKASDQIISTAYINMGVVYETINRYDSCLVMYKKAYDLLAPKGNSSHLAMLLNNIGSVLVKRKEYRDGTKSIERGLNMMLATGDMANAAMGMNNLSQLLFDSGKRDEGFKWSIKSFKLCDSMGFIRQKIVAANYLAKMYSEVNDYKSAYKYSRLYSSLNDSLRSEENLKSIAEMNSKYESEKKQKEIELLNKDKELHQTQLAEEKHFRYFIIGITFLLLSLAILLFYSLRTKQKTNKELNMKNEKIEQAYKVIEEKQTEILDSIRYAKRIQQSLLPHEKYIDKNINKLNKS